MIALHQVTDITWRSSGEAGSDRWLEVTFHQADNPTGTAITFYMREASAAYQKIKRMKDLIDIDKDGQVPVDSEFKWTNFPSPDPTPSVDQEEPLVETDPSFR